ncbi:MAG TPA: glycosyltransferase family 4 protein [Methylomirabilota bacterium]|nr:glycosyltransferase family 4 protein [Methylomirabilota bacterium]
MPLPPYTVGSAVVCAELLEGLAARGHRIWAVAPETPETRQDAGAFDDRRAEALRVTRFSVPYFEMFAFTGPDTASDGYRALERARLRRAVAASLAAEAPDVLLIGREVYGWHLAALVRAAGVPSLVISHGGPSTSILHGGWPAARARALLAGLSSADLVVSVARHWERALRRLGLRRVRTVPNPVDLARFTPGPRDPDLARSLGIGPEDVVALHASNLSPVKRVGDFVAAVAAARRRGARVVGLVLGDGLERAAAEEPSRREGTPSVFRFAGWVDHGAVPAYLRLADLVVSTSAHETQSLVYLEAQAAGRCLVASDIPGAREVVRDGETGILFPAGDVEALARVVARLAADPGRRRAIGLAARRRVASHAASRVIGAYERCLAALAAGRRPPLRLHGSR